MTGPRTCKRSMRREKKGKLSLMNPGKAGENKNPNYSEAVAPPLLGVWWVIKISCIHFTQAKIAIYNDLTFIF